MEDDRIEYSKVIYENDLKDLQWRLTVTFFKGNYYLNIRKYFLTFEEDYQPTREGMTIPLEINSTINLMTGLAEIVSQAEMREVFKEFLKNESE